jgi:hypothetical protein
MATFTSVLAVFAHFWRFVAFWRTSGGSVAHNPPPPHKGFAVLVANQTATKPKKSVYMGHDTMLEKIDDEKNPTEWSEFFRFNLYLCYHNVSFISFVFHSQR